MILPDTSRKGWATGTVTGWPIDLDGDVLAVLLLSGRIQPDELAARVAAEKAFVIIPDGRAADDVFSHGYYFM
jgi:hypothetical protein